MFASAIATPPERPVVPPPSGAARTEDASVLPASPAPTRLRVQLDAVQRIAGIVTAVILAIAALRLARDFFTPLAAAVVAALMLAPAVKALSRVLPRRLAAGLVVFAVACAVGGSIYRLGADAVALADRLPAAVHELSEAVHVSSSGRDFFSRLQATFDEVQRASGPAVTPGATPVQVVEPPMQGQVLRAFGNAGFVVAQVVLVFFLLYFLLAEGDAFKRKLVRLCGPQLSSRVRAVELMDDIVQRSTHVMVQTLLISAVVGISTGAAFWALGVQHAAFWGVAAGVLHVLPYIGELIVTVAAGLAALVQFHHVGDAVMVAGTEVGIAVVVGMWLSPMWFGRTSHVNPAAVFLALLFWNWLWGPAGVLLAMPLLVAAKAVADRTPGLSVLSVLLSD